MSDFRLISDSTTDISQDMVDELDVTIIPIYFIMDDVTYKQLPDESDMNVHDFYERIRAGELSSTAQVNSEEFTDYFEPFLKNGEDILYLAFSSGLSGTCQSANIAMNDLREKYPDRKMYVVDSLSASLGEGLLLWHAAQLKKEGKSIDEVRDWLEENKLHLAHWFTVDDLYHLKRGGRIGAGAALVGTMLGIKPVLHVDNEGHLVPVTKVRGRKLALDYLVKVIEESGIEPENQMIFINHGDCLEDAKAVEKEIRKRIGTKRTYINTIGPVIGGHSGPGTVSTFFLAKDRGESEKK